MTSPSSQDEIVRIREHWAAIDPDALTETCVGDRRCSIDLRSLDTACLACDSSANFSASGKKPDFIIATPNPDGGMLWLIVEMTTGGSGAKGATELHQQLQAGADLVTHDQALQSPLAELLPVVLVRKDKKVAAIQQLDRPMYDVSYRGRKVRIRRRFCGDTLAEVITPTKSDRWRTLRP